MNTPTTNTLPTNTPAVSVIVPCYNVPATVAETVASISRQTIQEIEIIAVDNNSTDDTRQVLNDCAAREPRLRIIEQPVQGLSAARNAGIEAARAEVVAFLDSDDLIDPEYLAAHLANLSSRAADISYARVRFIDLEGRATGRTTHSPIEGLTAADLLRSNPCTAFIVVCKNVFQRAGGFDQTLKSVEDQEFLFRALVHGAHLGGIDRVLASYRINPAGLSANLPRMLESQERLLSIASRMAPELVIAHRRLARASMLRYCARRAVEQGMAAGVSMRYFADMLRLAPDLALREPMTTFKVGVRVLLAQFSDVRGGSRQGTQTTASSATGGEVR